MNIKIYLGLFFCILISISGCSQIEPVLDSNGPIDRAESFQYKQFKASFDNANKLALEVSKANISSSEKNVQTSYTQMVIDGFGLADAVCADFFRESGKSQTFTMVARDIFAATGTLATALAAITNSPNSVTAGLSIGTTAGYNALDVYQRNFLFGADNIESVKELVARALAMHTEATLKTTKDTPWIGFGEAASSIMDHQAICFPASILLLSRSAIKNGGVEPVPSGGRKFSVSVTAATPRTTGIATAIVPNTRAAENTGKVAQSTPLPADLRARKTALIQFVRRLAATVKPGEVADSDLRKIAVALKAPISSPEADAKGSGEQRDKIVAFLLASLNSNDPEKLRSELDSISKTLDEAGIHQKF